MANRNWFIRNQNGSSELYHYGVLGMKWGVRKDQEKSSTRSNKHKKDKTLNSYKVTELIKAVSDSVSKFVSDGIAFVKNFFKKS